MFPLTGTQYPSWYLNDFIPSEKTQEYIHAIELAHKSWIESRTSREQLSRDLWEQLQPILEPVTLIERDGKKYRLCCLAGPVGFYRRSLPLGISKDRGRKNTFYKGMVFLDDAGELRFYNLEKEKILTLCPETGKLILFDLREFHSGTQFNSYNLVFRLLYDEI